MCQPPTAALSMTMCALHAHCGLPLDAHISPLRAGMQEGPSWQACLRALCAVEAIVQRGSSAAAGEAAVFFQVLRGRSCITQPKAHHSTAAGTCAHAVLRPPRALRLDDNIAEGALTRWTGQL